MNIQLTSKPNHRKLFTTVTIASLLSSAIAYYGIAQLRLSSGRRASGTNGCEPGDRDRRAEQSGVKSSCGAIADSGSVLGLTIVMCVASGAVAMRKLQSADPADIL